MNNTKTVLIILALCLLIVPVASALDSATILRENNGNTISPATQNQPLFQINETGPYQGGTNNQDFVQLINNYDETLSVVVSLSNDNWNFADGSTSQTFTLTEGETVQTTIEIGGSNQNCNQKQNTYDYTYSVSGPTMSIDQITNQVTICGGAGGGNGNGNGNGGGNGGGPGGNGPPGQGGGGPPGQNKMISTNF